MKHYNIFNHTADLGVEVFGETLPDLFSHAALALADLLVEGMEALETAFPDTRAIVIEGSDIADLFVNFLREILYLFNGEGLILKTCRIVRIDDRSLVAELCGERYDPERHRVRMEIKAVTYHQAAVEKTVEGWEGRVVFDV